MGRPVPHIHGGEGHTCGQSASCGQEALGPVQAVRLCQRDWRFSTGEKCLKSQPSEEAIHNFPEYFLLVTQRHSQP